MTFVLNVLIGLLAFVVARYVLALVGLDEAIGWILSVIIGIVVFASNPVGKLDR